MLLSIHPPIGPDLVLSGSAQAAFHERAANSTRQVFGRAVFVRAVVEVSNFCRENCSYCGMRRDNRDLARYRAVAEQLSQLLVQDRPRSVTDVNIQAGEDPVAVREVVLPLIRTLRRETSLGISVCLGTLPGLLYDELRLAGAEVYIMKFECGAADQYARFAAPGTLSERLRHIRQLSSGGWIVSSGFIVGLPGQAASDLWRNVQLARSLPIQGCSVSPFIPGEDTPLAGEMPACADWTFNCMAALRLTRPDWVIPAVSALNLAEQDGYVRGLQSGANLVTINLTPRELRGDYVIYKRQRFIMTEERVLSAISVAGLVPSKLGLVEFYRARASAGEPAAKPAVTQG